MRRVDAIALVHETLSVALDESVPFDQIVERLLQMLSDVMGSAGRVALKRTGSFGVLPAETATALVLVLTELVQNAVEHAFPAHREGVVEVGAVRARGSLTVTVSDDGVGLPDGFSLGKADRLGLQIVRTLVSAELAGGIEIAGRPDGHGTLVVLTLSLSRSRS